MLLLVGAGLFLQTMRNLTHSGVGFDADDLLQVLIDTRGAGYREGSVGAVHRLLLERVGAIPGVASVTSIRNPIMRHAGSRGFMRLPGFTPPEGEFWNTAEVGPSFLETMAIPLVRGRSFAPADFARGGGSFIVNEAWVSKYFPNEDPVARTELGIVGVIGRVKFGGVRDDDCAVDAPDAPRRAGPRERTAGADSGNTAAVSARDSRRDPRRAPAPVRRDIAPCARRSRAIWRPSAWWRRRAGSSACSACCSSRSACSASPPTPSRSGRRSSASGWRSARARWSVIRESLKETMWVFAAGLIAGTLASFAAVRFMASRMSDLLFGLTATDGVNIAAAVAVMIVVALVACIIPARHATRVDPLVAIRCE